MLRKRRIGTHPAAHIIKTLERPHTRRPHGDAPTVVPQYSVEDRTAHADILSVHLMPLNLRTLDGLERPRTNVKRHLCALKTAIIQPLQHTLREVETSRRSRYTTLYLRIYCLVRRLVTLLRLPVQVRRDGQFARCVEQFGKSHVPTVPLKTHTHASLVRLLHSAEPHVHVPDAHFPAQLTILPLLLIAHKAQPRTRIPRLEHLFVVSRSHRFKQEHLNQRTRFLAEMKPRLNHTRVVKHHQRIRRQIARKLRKHIFTQHSAPVNQKFRTVTLRQRELRYPPVRQQVVVITYPNMPNIHPLYNIKKRPHHTIQQTKHQQRDDNIDVHPAVTRISVLRRDVI